MQREGSGEDGLVQPQISGSKGTFLKFDPVQRSALSVCGTPAVLPARPSLGAQGPFAQGPAGKGEDKRESLGG